MIKPSLYWLLLLACSLPLGCAEQQYGACSAPQDDLQVLFKEKSKFNLFSHSFCIVCNPNLDEEEVVEWMMSMGADAVSEVPETPCLYAYADRETQPKGFETLAQCQEAICEGGASYHDVVSRENENIDLDPLIGPADGESLETKD